MAPLLTPSPPPCPPLFLTHQAALPHLKEGAAIINTSSVTAYAGKATLPDYASTKAAQVRGGGEVLGCMRDFLQAYYKPTDACTLPTDAPLRWPFLTPHAAK
jgi:hypothetical protein